MKRNEENWKYNQKKNKKRNYRKKIIENQPKMLSEIKDVIKK